VQAQILLLYGIVPCIDVANMLQYQDIIKYLVMKSSEKLAANQPPVGAVACEGAVGAAAKAEVVGEEEYLTGRIEELFAVLRVAEEQEGAEVGGGAAADTLEGTEKHFRLIDEFTGDQLLKKIQTKFSGGDEMLETELNIIQFLSINYNNVHLLERAIDKLIKEISSERMMEIVEDPKFFNQAGTEMSILQFILVKLNQGNDAEILQGKEYIRFLDIFNKVADHVGLENFAFYCDEETSEVDVRYLLYFALQNMQDKEMLDDEAFIGFIGKYKIVEYLRTEEFSDDEAFINFVKEYNILEKLFKYHEIDEFIYCVSSFVEVLQGDLANQNPDLVKNIHEIMSLGIDGKSFAEKVATWDSAVDEYKAPLESLLRKAKVTIAATEARIGNAAAKVTARRQDIEAAVAKARAEAEVAAKRRDIEAAVANAREEQRMNLAVKLQALSRGYITREAIKKERRTEETRRRKKERRRERQEIGRMAKEEGEQREWMKTEKEEQERIEKIRKELSEEKKVREEAEASWYAQQAAKTAAAIAQQAMMSAHEAANDALKTASEAQRTRAAELEMQALAKAREEAEARRCIEVTAISMTATIIKKAMMSAHEVANDALKVASEAQRTRAAELEILARAEEEEAISKIKYDNPCIEEVFRIIEELKGELDRDKIIGVDFCGSRMYKSELGCLIDDSTDLDVRVVFSRNDACFDYMTSLERIMGEKGYRRDGQVNTGVGNTTMTFVSDIAPNLDIILCNTEYRDNVNHLIKGKPELRYDFESEEWSLFHSDKAVDLDYYLKDRGALSSLRKYVNILHQSADIDRIKSMEDQLVELLGINLYKQDSLKSEFAKIEATIAKSGDDKEMYRTLMAEREGLIVILEMLELRNGLRYTLSTHSAEQEVIAAAAGGGGARIRSGVLTQDDEWRGVENRSDVSTALSGDGRGGADSKLSLLSEEDALEPLTSDGCRAAAAAASPFELTNKAPNLSATVSAVPGSTPGKPPSSPEGHKPSVEVGSQKGAFNSF
jgi:hypothetical protein